MLSTAAIATSTARSGRRRARSIRRSGSGVRSNVFGWHFTEGVDLGKRGTFQLFSWGAGGPSVGAFGDIAARPGVHPHWLFFFEVDALDRAMTAIHASGGVVIDT